MKIETSKEVPKFEKPLIEEGFYVGKLTEIKEFDGQYGKSLSLVYNIEGQDNVNLSHLITLPDKAHPENKLGRALMAHGVDLEKGEFDTDNLVGTKVKVFVETKEDTKDGTKYSSVTKVKAIESK